MHEYVDAIKWHYYLAHYWDYVLDIIRHNIHYNYRVGRLIRGVLLLVYLAKTAIGQPQAIFFKTGHLSFLLSENAYGWVDLVWPKKCPDDIFACIARLRAAGTVTDSLFNGPRVDFLAHLGFVICAELRFLAYSPIALHGRNYFTKCT